MDILEIILHTLTGEKLSIPIENIAKCMINNVNYTAGQKWLTAETADCFLLEFKPKGNIAFSGGAVNTEEDIYMPLFYCRDIVSVLIRGKDSEMLYRLPWRKSAEGKNLLQSVFRNRRKNIKIVVKSKKKLPE